MKSKAIDYLKALACILIVNSHIATLYPPRISFLSMGGYFGNCLFFFVSGYCLTSTKLSFPKWYYKRFIRCYLPYLLFLPFLVFAGRLANETVLSLIFPYNLYHFIPTILIWYIFYYFVSKLNNKVAMAYPICACITAVLMIMYFFTFYDYEHGNIYEHFTPLEMTSYFVVMCTGGWAKTAKKLPRIFVSLGIAFASFVLYAYQSIFHFPKVLSLLQLFIGIAFSFGLGCFFLRLENKLPKLEIVSLVSAVTLEVYICHRICIDAYAAIGFPTNIVFLYISAIAVGYCLHWVSSKIIPYLCKVN